MSINLTDELLAKTKKGKIASAKQVFLEGDQENLQQIGDKTHQLEDAIKDISISGGASTANAVSYNNNTSGMTAVTAQGAIDELAAKNKIQDVTIGTKAEKTDVATELDKKFDKENIAQEFGDSENKVVSQFALPFREIESPEFIKAIVDTEDHFLFGIQLDGSIEWGKGIPAPIRAKLHEIINQCQHDNADVLATIYSVKEELTASLQAYQQTTDASITALQEGKVDKEEGKSLIEDEVKEHFRVIENEEFLKAVIDSEERVLYGIYRDTGKPYYPLNEMYHVIQNEEYFAAWVTTDDKVVLGIRRDGQIIGEIHAVNALKQVISTIQEKLDTIDSNLKELLDIFSLQENPEYMAVETDADGKILSATKSDGSHYSRNLKSETIDAKVDKEEGKSLIDFNVAEAHSTFEDLEKRMEIVTDADGNLLSERSAEGEKHEVKMNIDNLKVSNLNFQGNSVEDIKSALKSNGFYVAVDWSDSKDIQIPEPRCSCVNITNIKYMPTTKNQNLRAYFEFWDMQGNYFKKKVILNAQGNSSLAMPKKNFACDFCNDDWIGDDTFKIKFGSWVSQDSFHFKAFYADFFKGVSMVGYKLFNEIENTRKFSTNRIWKRALLPSNETIGYGTKGMSDITDINVLIDNGARCYPDGFPCIVYLNGEFYGVFSWALKKHRDNYMQNKSKAEHIQLDGAIYDTFTYNGTINWNVVNGIEATLNGGKDGFEFRNPKSLVCIDGTKYDADKNRKELIESTSPLFNEKDKNHVLSNKVKGYYTQLTTYIPTLQSMKDGNGDSAAIKAKIQTYFDVDSLIDYLIFSDVVNNTDGFLKNWQWVTYDGIKWAVCPYDLDGILGWNGWNETSPNHEPFGDSLVLPTGWIRLYFHNELCQRYSELRKEILTVENIFGLLNDWCSRIGAANLKKDLSKWPQTPELYSHFKEEHTDNIYRVYNWIVQKLNKCDKYYSFNN